MAISIDWGTKTINVPRLDLTLIQAVPTEIRQLNLDTFRLILKDLEDDSDGMAFERTHKHNTSVTVGGVVLARVVEIINGYTITFEDGQYAVNLVGANSNVGDVVNVNQVSVRSANSAGLQDLSTLLASAYQGQVVVSSTGQAGTDSPIGTYKTPSNNVTDAIKIANIQGIKNILFLESINLAEDLSGGFNLRGDSPFNLLTVQAIANVVEASVTNMTVNGELDGLNTIRESSILSATNVSGFIFQCSFAGDIALKGSVNILQCFSGLPEPLCPNIVCTPGASIQIRNFNGSLGLKSITDSNHSIQVNGGNITIDSTCTGGNIRILGEPYDVIDNSVGSNVIFEDYSRWQNRKALTTSKFLGLK